MKTSRVLAFALLVATAAEAQITPREYAGRRASLAASLPDAVILAVGAPEPAEDYLTFYPTPALRYLTGIREPDVALVLVKQNSSVTGTVFVTRRDPAREVWSGRRIGIDSAQRLTGLAARDRATLDEFLDSLAATRLPLYTIGVNGAVAGTLLRRQPQWRIETADAKLDSLRGRKSAAELALIRKAVDITVLAQREAIRAANASMHEYELEALIEYTFRRNGAERPAFASIVGSGPNSTTLHYNANDRRMRPGDVVVMDVGASYEGYAADVTRTIPASGSFSPEQRQVYQIVRDAQAAAERQAKPGAASRQMSDSATAVIAAGLAGLGLIDSPGATFDCPAGCPARSMPQYFLFYMHGLGHGIGLEVHDPEQFYYTGIIAPGSAFTIEPGIYVRANVLETLADTPANRALIARIRPAVERYGNIGVRIEDDYVVTDRGVEWISRAPREMDEIERLIKQGSGMRD